LLNFITELVWIKVARLRLLIYRRFSRLQQILIGVAPRVRITSDEHVDNSQTNNSDKSKSSGL